MAGSEKNGLMAARADLFQNAACLLTNDSNASEQLAEVRLRGRAPALIGVGLMGGGLLSRSPMEMVPGSRLLRRLAGDTFPPGVPLTSIYSRHDLVCPWWSSVLHPRPGESSMR